MNFMKVALLVVVCAIGHDVYSFRSQVERKTRKDVNQKLPDLIKEWVVKRK